MDAWSQSGQPDCAHRLLQEMMQAYRQSGRDPSLKPNAITYSTIIHGYAVSDDAEKAVHAYQIWKEMQTEGVKPNGVTLNNVLNACATTRPPTPIVRHMIQSLYQYALCHGQPDEVTFGIVLKACENWRNDNATTTTLCPSEVFREACRRGMVSSGVLHHLRQAVPISTYSSLVGESGSWADLPQPWRQRVRHSGARLGRRRR
jgi:pentatricopeptide repeat protein